MSFLAHLQILYAITFKTEKKTMVLCHSIDCFKNLNFWADVVHNNFNKYVLYGYRLYAIILRLRILLIKN